MTFAIFIGLFLVLFVAFLNWLPVAGGLDSGISAAIFTIIGSMKAWNFIFPISELFTCVLIILAYEVLYWGYKAVLGAVHLIRGTNSGA